MSIMSLNSKNQFFLLMRNWLTLGRGMSSLHSFSFSFKKLWKKGSKLTVRSPTLLDFKIGFSIMDSI